MEREQCILPNKCYIMEEEEMSKIYGGNYCKLLAELFE